MSDYQKNQETIVRQSSLKFVGDYCKMLGSPLTLQEIIGITNVVTEYCLNGYTKEIKEKVSKVDNYLHKKFED